VSRNAIKSAICSTVTALSKPSGISERPEPESCAMSRRRTTRQAVGAFERQARRAFFSDDAVHRAAIFCFDGVANKVRRDLAIRIENVDEDLITVPLRHAPLSISRLGP
jgi:hypothetical protein